MRQRESFRTGFHNLLEQKFIARIQAYLVGLVPKGGVFTMKNYMNCNLISLVCVLILLSSCAAQNPQQELARFSSQENRQISEAARIERTSGNGIHFAELETTRAREIIAPGFELDIVVIEDPNLSGTYRVGFDGNIELPYNVRVKAADHSSTSLERSIQQAYAQYFRNPPSVEVKISEYSYYVDVRGLVNEPGQYLVQRESSLDEVLGKAGGLQRAERETQAARFVRFEQLDQTRMLRLTDYYSGSAAAKVEWMGGDVVFFQSESDGMLSAGYDGRDGYLQILGQVRDPGEYQVVSNLSFYDYLARAGGPTDRANLKRIEVVRRNGAGQKSVVFDLNRAQELPVLESGDLVMIHSQDPNVLIPNVTGIIGSIATVIFAAFAI